MRSRSGRAHDRPRLTAAPAEGASAFDRAVQPLYGVLAGRQGTWTDLRARDSITASLHLLGGGVEVRVRVHESGRYTVTVRRRRGERPLVVAAGQMFPDRD